MSRTSTSCSLLCGWGTLHLFSFRCLSSLCSITCYSSMYTHAVTPSVRGVPRLEGSAQLEWDSPTLGSPNRDNSLWRELAVVMLDATWGGGLLGRSFLPGLSTNHILIAHSRRTRSIQNYHPHSNKLANPNRVTVKQTRKAAEALTTSLCKLR